MFRVFMIRKNEEGQSIVEFALVLPIFLAILLVLIQFGMVLSAQIAVTNAAREGARAAAVGTPLGTTADLAGANSVYGVVKRALGGHGYINYNGLTIPGPLNTTIGGTIEVHVSGLKVDAIVPIPSLNGFMFGEDNIEDSGYQFPVEGKATMRLEYLPSPGGG